MLNDLSSTLALLETRRSGRPRDMVAPGPSAEQLERILAIAARVPDHGKLFPWRFVTVAADQRDALADLLARALPEHDPDALPAHHAKAQEFARQAPALVVVLSSPVPEHKIPLWEQELSAGAAAMNLLLATHAMGFVGGWITGWAAYSEMVRAAFCAPGERIVGFFFLGTPRLPLEERPRAPLATIVRRWTPPGA
ncbi:MAG TPA: nitroreductase [Sphingomicrobium sp.]|jgi:nitroreductase|nr:nitroreductase [Sphingomicrobium sp.]